MRSRMASAKVGSPMISCQRSTGTWLVIEDGAGVVSVLDDLHQIAALLGGQRLRSPIVEDQQIDAARASAAAWRIVRHRGRVRERRTDAARGDRGPRGPPGRPFGRGRKPASFCRRRSGPVIEQITPRADPFAVCELEEQRAIEAASSTVVDVLDAGLMAQPGAPGRVRSNRFWRRSVTSCSSSRPAIRHGSRLARLGLGFERP